MSTDIQNAGLHYGTWHLQSVEKVSPIKKLTNRANLIFYVDILQLVEAQLML